MNTFVLNLSVQDGDWAAKPPRMPRSVHRRFPGYARTPLRSLPEAATRLGIGGLLVKDEQERLTLPAFKILGASYAVYRLIGKMLGEDPEGWKSVDELRELARSLGTVRLVTATDGNHGRGVARVARWLGFEAKVFMPHGSAGERVEAIRSEGADVTVINGNYDEAVRQASALQGERSFLVQDTSWPGYEEIPGWIVEGYSTLLWEIEDALRESAWEPPDLVLVPVGTGALAAAVIRHFRRKGLVQRPRILGVESNASACALSSLRAGERVTVPGEAETIMVGLNCGTLATIAWPMIQRGMDAVLALDDTWARRAVRFLAAEGVVSGESGSATTAGLLALVQDPELVELKQALHLGPSDRVLVFSTEGITHPGIYDQILAERD